MTSTDLLAELQSLGSASYKKVMLNHGAREPFYGVKIEDLKKIVKRVKKDYQLALDLYATGVSDAMYLAALIADDARMTRDDLNGWVENAYFPTLSEYAVPWVAAASPHGRELGLHWLDSPREGIAAAGWSTLGSLVAIKPDSQLDLDELRQLLDRVGESVHQQPNRVRYAMNGFVIAAGSYVEPLTEHALKTAARIGTVLVDMGGTACKVPAADEQIHKVQQRGAIGKKRRSARC